MVTLRANFVQTETRRTERELAIRGRGPADNPRVPLDELLASLRPGGRDFELVCKWLLENVPKYRTKLRQVWLWDEWPGRSSRDIGIDLVAEARDGGLWAIQAKLLLIT